MTNKPFGVLVVLAAAVAALPVGCGRDRSEEDAKTLTIWWAQWAPSDGLQELGEAFHKETGIRVNVHQIPWSDYQNKVFLNFGNRQTDFDIVVGDSQWIGRGAEKGLYLDLTDWLPKAVDLKAIHPNALKYLCRYQGRYYAAPCETDAVGFAYRRDWFEDPAEREAFEARYGRELGVPKTWEQFREVAEFFTRPDEKRYGCALLTGRDYDSLTMGFQHFLWSFGGSWADEATRRVQGHVNGPGAVEGLAFMKALLAYAPPDARNYNYGKATDAFVAEPGVAMGMAYFAFFPKIAEKMGDRAGFFAVPAHEGRRFCSVGGQGFSISTKIPPARQELAKRFIRWFCRTDVQSRWITKPAGFTAHVAILRSGAFKAAAPYNAAFAASLDHMRDFWNVPVYNELLKVAQQHVGRALDGEVAETAALDAVAAEHEKILRKADLLK
jgi:multiple sugar transport system substrate-binding protein